METRQPGANAKVEMHASQSAKISNHMQRDITKGRAQAETAA
jgi:hypothetical protein